jgi:hypothetical protein
MTVKDLMSKLEKLNLNNHLDNCVIKLETEPYNFDECKTIIIKWTDEGTTFLNDKATPKAIDIILKP